MMSSFHVFLLILAFVCCCMAIAVMIVNKLPGVSHEFHPNSLRVRLAVMFILVATGLIIGALGAQV